MGSAVLDGVRVPAEPVCGGPVLRRPRRRAGRGVESGLLASDAPLRPGWCFSCLCLQPSSIQEDEVVWI